MIQPSLRYNSAYRSLTARPLNPNDPNHMPSNPPRHIPAVLGLLAWSGSGKTTLLKALIPALARHGIRCSAIKTTHHDFDIDKPGKDSFEIRKAGAYQTLLASPHRQALVTERDGNEKHDIDTLLGQLQLELVQLVIVEGFRDANIPKIEIYRPSQKREAFFPHTQNVIAVASDAPLETGKRANLDLNQPESIAQFIIQHFTLKVSQSVQD